MIYATENNSAVRLTERGIEIGGSYQTLLCASLFYFRIPRAAWKDRIAKLKRAGYNCVDVYFPWNFHEQADGSFNFSEDRDVTFFLEQLRAAGLFVIARPGPYICSEWDGGALPARILESGMPIRCDHPAFLHEVQKWYSAILPLIEPFTCERGGTVILLQLENELDFFDCPNPSAYIAALLRMARAFCPNIPCFCCAGQFDVTRAGGLCAGVEATLNCYPESLDPAFDAELQGYALRFAALHKPLLVSETNRDHFLLRRELSCGAKLLGAYNQVAGFNFGYHQAVNNWGKPDSVMVSEYDFGSMIDAAGNYTAEAQNALLFAAFLRTMGEALSAALPEPQPILPERCTFVTAEGGLRALALYGGGYAVCVPNFSQRGEISFTFRGKNIASEVLPVTAGFFLFEVPLARLGIRATLTRSNCELIAAEEHDLFFYAPVAPFVGIDFGEGEVCLRKEGSVHGVNVHFLNKEEAISLLSGEQPIRAATYTARPAEGFTRAALPVRRQLAPKERQTFGSYAVQTGALRYLLRLPPHSSLFIEGPCDLIRVGTDGKRGETVFCDGRDLILPSADGIFDIVIEKWGHCNFDDSQSPSLRISSCKGALSFGRVREQRIGRCDFHLLERYKEERLCFEESFPVRLAVEKWNSTRKPAICAYTFPATREEERLILKTTENTDVAVYLDGALVGECDFATFELTPFFAPGQTREVTLVYRKRVWTQEVGSIRLLHVSSVLPQQVSALSEQEMLSAASAALSAGAAPENKPLCLPLPLAEEQAFLLPFSTQKEGYLKFYGKDVKLTCVLGKKVVGRLFVGWEHAPVLKGGDPARILLPAGSGHLYLFAEPLAPGAQLSGAQLFTAEG